MLKPNPKFDTDYDPLKWSPLVGFTMGNTPVFFRNWSQLCLGSPVDGHVIYNSDEPDGLIVNGYENAVVFVNCSETSVTVSFVSFTGYIVKQSLPESFDFELLDIILVERLHEILTVASFSSAGGVRHFVLRKHEPAEEIELPLGTIVYADLNTGIFILEDKNPPKDSQYWVSKTNEIKPTRLVGEFLHAKDGQVILRIEDRDCERFLIQNLEDMSISDPFPNIQFQNAVDAKFLTADTVLLIWHRYGHQFLEGYNINRCVTLWTKENAGFIRLSETQGDRVGVAFSDTVQGSSWGYADQGGVNLSFSGCKTLANIKTTNLSFSSGGCMTLYLATDTDQRKCVISFHGGPESIEYPSLRHGGLYRLLLKLGICVVVVNYSGSKGFGCEVRENPHGNWAETFQVELHEVFQYLTEKFGISEPNCVLFGGSFGGTLALQGAQSSSVAGAVIVSPVLDLQRHIARVDDESFGYKNWFDKRFSDGDYYQYSLKTKVPRQGERIHINHGKKDAVVSCCEAQELFRQLGEQTGWSFDFPRANDHNPKSSEEELERRSRILADILDMFIHARGND